MDHILAVNVLESLSYLVDVVCCTCLLVPTFWLGFKVIIEFSTGHILQNQVDLFIIIKTTVERKYVFMAKVTSYFNFPLKLFFNSVSNKLTFIKNLYRDQEFRFLFSREVNVAKLALTKRLAKLKVLYAPLKWIERSVLVLLFFEVLWVGQISIFGSFCLNGITLRRLNFVPKLNLTGLLDCVDNFNSISSSRLLRLRRIEVASHNT